MLSLNKQVCIDVLSDMVRKVAFLTHFLLSLNNPFFRCAAYQTAVPAAFRTRQTSSFPLACFASWCVSDHTPTELVSLL